VLIRESASVRAAIAEAHSAFDLPTVLIRAGLDERQLESPTMAARRASWKGLRRNDPRSASMDPCRPGNAALASNAF
jgi:hypothetical protein